MGELALQLADQVEVRSVVFNRLDINDRCRRADVVGGGMVFVIFRCRFFTGTEVGLQATAA